MFSPMLFINRKTCSLVRIHFNTTSMRIQKITAIEKNAEIDVTSKNKLMDDYVGCGFYNLQQQHDISMDIMHWAVLLCVDKFLYLVKIPKERVNVFEQNASFFKTPQVDVKTAMELLEL